MQHAQVRHRTRPGHAVPTRRPQTLQRQRVNRADQIRYPPSSLTAAERLARDVVRQLLRRVPSRLAQHFSRVVVGIVPPDVSPVPNGGGFNSAGFLVDVPVASRTPPDSFIRDLLRRLQAEYQRAALGRERLRACLLGDERLRRGPERGVECELVGGIRGGNVRNV